jgi:hypothetical protein
LAKKAKSLVKKKRRKRMRTVRTAPGITRSEPLRKYLLEEIRDRAGEFWQRALSDLRAQLTEHCLNFKGTKLRFQQGRLIRNLHKVINERGDGGLSRLADCYWFVTASPWATRLGYDDARRLHLEEMQALGFAPLLSKERTAQELDPRLQSVASWLEAHESFIIWQMLNHNRASWDADDYGARKRAATAGLLADLPARWSSFSGRSSEYPIWRVVTTFLATERCDVGKDGSANFVPWPKKQWKIVLQQATKLAGKTSTDCSLLEKWVWWLYPIFYRYRWSAREVCDLAATKFPNFKEKSQESFQQYWIRRGLRFIGKKRKYTRAGKREKPPLTEFVETAQVPEKVGFDYPTWASIPYENSPTSA